MVDPISPLSSFVVTPPMDLDFHVKAVNPVLDEKENARKASSFYYASTLMSLQPLPNATEGQKIQDVSIQSNKSFSSVIQGCWNWVLGLFGKSSAQTVETDATTDQNTQVPPLSGAPRLQDPTEIDKNKLSKMIAELNEHIHRMKDMSEFEEELRRTTSSTKSFQLDKLIINQYFIASMRQKISKEELGLDEQQNILRMHQQNKQLQEKYFSLLDEVKSRAQMTSLLGWINFGSTIGIVGALAVSFAITGPVAIIIVGLPALGVVKGVVSGAEGILKYKNNLKTGELFAIQEESNELMHQMKDGMEELKVCDEEISQILKTVREQLKNQSDAERIFRGAPTY